MTEDSPAADSMAIAPDEKDWTWTLTQACPECGFVAGSVEGSQIADLITAVTQPWGEVLRREAARVRPEPTTWSPLEYACHIRDVCTVFEARLELMLTQENPAFANWDQDEIAVQERYGEQDPAQVAEELAAAAAAFATRYAGVTGAQWDRAGVRSNGSRFTVLTLGQYGLHDLRHHLHDVDAAPAA